MIILYYILAGTQQRCCVASAAAAAGMGAGASSKYAILQLGGVRQMLQEGLLYTCPKHCLVQEQQQQYDQFSTGPAAGNGSSCSHPQHPAQADHASTAEQRSYLLSNVLGLHNGQQFTWGKPYVPNTLVEVEVVEEWEGPRPSSSIPAAVPAPDSTMTIYRVKQIRAGL